MTDVIKPTKKAKAFMEANDQHFVVEGWAFGDGGLGGAYILSNGERFDLNLKDCQSLSDGYPKWWLPDEEPKNGLKTEIKREYVLGFAYWRKHAVALIYKTRGPSNLHHKWNGIGGKLEAGENVYEAMVREFKEETGLDTDITRWRKFSTASSDYFTMHCLSIDIEGDFPVIKNTEEGDEEVAWFTIDDIPNNINDNLLYLIPMGLDPHIRDSVIEYKNNVE